MSKKESQTTLSGDDDKKPWHSSWWQENYGSTRGLFLELREGRICLHGMQGRAAAGIAGLLGLFNANAPEIRAGYQQHHN